MIETVKINLQQLLSFLKKPTDTGESGMGVSAKLKRLFILLIIDMGLIVVIVWPIMTLVEATGLVDLESHEISKMMRDGPVWVILLLAVLIAPVMEELIFRAFLTYKRNYLFRLVIVLAGIRNFRAKAKISGFLKRNWRKYYPIFFYFMAAIFAVVHIFNFGITKWVLLLMPLLVLPQFIAGLLLGYVRVRLGLVWSIYMHGIHNFILVGGSLLFIHETIEKVNLETEAYEIKIEEVTYYETSSTRTSSSAGALSISLHHVEMKDVLLYLLDKDESLLEIKNPEKAKVFLNINFTSKIDTLNGKQLVLEQLQKAYSLNILKEQRMLPYYDLQLTDSLQLKRHRSASDETGATIKSFKESLQMENVNVGMLVENLNEKTGAPVMCAMNLEGLYNFNLTISPVEALQQHLVQEYGLVMVQKEKRFDFVTVEF